MVILAFLGKVTNTPHRHEKYIISALYEVVSSGFANF